MTDDRPGSARDVTDGACPETGGGERRPACESFGFMSPAIQLEDSNIIQLPFLTST